MEFERISNLYSQSCKIWKFLKKKKSEKSKIHKNHKFQQNQLARQIESTRRQRDDSSDAPLNQIADRISSSVALAMPKTTVKGWNFN